ncbi:Uncharacterised protein [uncultured archaeon]|nr:Uncharacterised protein [uncultured archaeon]
MKLALLVILDLITFCLIASAEPVAIGGDFGRAWISNYLAKNPSPFSQDNNSSSGSWGIAPKVQGTIGSNMVSQQNATNPVTPSTNWLGDATNLGNPSSPKNFTQVPFLIIGGLSPVHAIDASWNHTAQMPQPDANGLIHGWDAETYDAIGPALDYF